MNYLITLLARGGSVGVPSKNIKKLNNRPLIDYSIQVANELKTILGATVALSTDSEEIRVIAAECGLTTEYLRTPELATSTISKKPALIDLIKYEEKRTGLFFDYVIDFDVTSPLRQVKDVLNALEIIKSEPDALNLITVSKASRNPYFNMVEKKENGFYDVCLKKKPPIFSRQSAPPVFDMNSNFYIFKKAYFNSDFGGSLTDSTLIYEIEHPCYDIDEPLDFEFVEFLIQKNQVKK